MFFFFFFFFFFFVRISEFSTWLIFGLYTVCFWDNIVPLFKTIPVMKLHLPAKLLAAVIATFSVGLTHAAAYFDSIDDIIYVAAGETQQFIPTASAPSSSYAVAKDGEGTLTFTGTGTMYETLYVREGEMQFGDGETETSIRFQPIKNGAQGRYTALGVAGKDAVVRFNKANVTCNETANFVGGLDGNGKMIIENGSNVDFAGSNVFVIGDIAAEDAVDPETGVPDGYNNSTTALPGAAVDTGDNRYQGNYTPCTNGSDYTLGRGEVLVTGGSYFRATYGSFWIINGSMTVEGKGTVADIALPDYGYRFWMGTGSGNTDSSLYVKDGAVTTAYMYQMCMTYGDKSSSLLEVDNATFTLVGRIYKNSESEFYVGYQTATQGSATVNIINGGTFNIGSTYTYVGEDSNDGTIDAQVYVDKDSSLTAKDVSLYKGATVTNEGSFTAINLTMNDGELTNSGLLNIADEEPDSCATLAVWSGTLTNSGTLNVEDIWVGGKLANTGNINADYVSVMGEGVLTLTQNAGTLSASCVEVDEAGKVEFNVSSAISSNAAITLVSGAYDQVLDLYEGSVVNLVFGEDCLTETETTVNVWFATGATDEALLGSTITTSGLDAAFWDTSNLTWNTDGSNIFISGTIISKTEIEMGDDNASSDIGDNVAGESVSVDITNDITLSGDNSYSGGTTVTGATVTLGSENALGNGGVATSGNSMLSTDADITADVKGELTVNDGSLTMSGNFNIDGAVENKGELTMEGNIATTGKITNDGTLNLSGSNAISQTIANNGLLNLNGAVDASGIATNAINETLIGVDGQTGSNGFKRDEGSSFQLASNGTDATIGTGEDLVVTHNGTQYEFDSSTGIAYAHGQTHHGVYFINTEDHAVSISEIDASSNNATEKVVMQNGSLTADSDATLQSTGGSLVAFSGTISGAIADTSVAVHGGTIAASVTGGTLAAVAGEISGSITNADITAEGAAISGAITGGTLAAVAGEISGSITNADITAEGATISGDITGGTLSLTFGNVSGTVSDTAITAGGGVISGDIAGTSSLEVAGEVSLGGENTFSGDTVIKGEDAKLLLAAGSSLGTGKVLLDEHATLDLGGNAISNYINVTGCTLKGAGSFTGQMDVSGNLELVDATSASKVVMQGNGSIKGAPLTTTELSVETNGNATIDGNLTINNNGTITLNNGNTLKVTGSLTLGNGTSLVLNGDYAAGDKLLTSESGVLTLGDVTLVYGDSAVELEVQDGSLVLVSNITEPEPEPETPSEPTIVFDQQLADSLVLNNWGMLTASRSFVNAVRGQRTNTGCIANGRGTAWVAVLGASNELDGGDIDLQGAAIGADVKVGNASSVGVAFGSIDGDATPTGLSKAEQEGSYMALYGEHGLKKLSATSCLSMDWVAAYGQTESKLGGQKWEQDSLQLNSRLSWNKKVTNRLCMSVFGGVEYYTNESDTVNGVKTGSIQNLRGEVGVGARYVAWGTPATGKGGLIQFGCEKLVLHGELRYMNDMVRSNPVVRMSGMSGMGENPGRQGMGIEAGATYRFSERWSATANYGFNTMGDSKEHRVNVGASYTF